MSVSQWQDHIGSIAPVAEDDGGRQNNAQLFDLSALAIVDISGEDAGDFLQGQFCNDLAEVSETCSQITGYCNPKGRLLALPLITGTAAGFRLALPDDVVEPFIKRLSMFVMRSKVTITRRDDWVCVGISVQGEGAGPGSDQSHELFRDLPPALMSVAGSESDQILRWHDDLAGALPRARYLRMASVENQIAFWNNCHECPKYDILRWRAADVAAGVPSIRQAVVEAFVPQMINLQLINGLSFTKGCYPGQEIVARMQYLGKIKRHMRLFSIERVADNAVPQPGDSLRTDEDADAGVVLDAQPIGSGKALLLAVVKVSANDATLYASDIDLVHLDLPYALPSLDALGTAADADS